jgi:hypothetical protein
LRNHKDQRKKREKKHRHFCFYSSARRDDHIAHAARAGNLPAVRGHLRFDRGSLDLLIDDESALHYAALNDHPAVVAFLVAKGAAVDVLSGLGPGAQQSPPVTAPRVPL